MELKLETTLKEYYKEKHPTDDICDSMNDQATFRDLIIQLIDHEDVYDIIGVGDSLVRECLFEGLSKLFLVDYDYVYDLWLQGA